MYILIALAIIILVIVIYSSTKKTTTQKIASSKKNIEHKIISRSGMKNAKYSGNMFNTSTTKNNKDSPHPITKIIDNTDSNTLTLAAEAGHAAKKAVKDKDYNKAWGLLSEQKSLYMKHSQAIGYNAQDALSLDSNVHESYANILRLENKHYDAFFHILYWVMASYHRPIKKHEHKLVAYFNRCKFKKIILNDVQSYVKQHGPSLVNILEIKDQVKQWKDNE